MRVAKREILQIGSVSMLIVTAVITVAMLVKVAREAVSPQPSKVLFRGFLFVAKELNLTFRIDEKIYVNRDEYLVVFSGMARDSAGKMLPKETAIPGSIVGSTEGLIARGDSGGRIYWAVGRHPHEVRERLVLALNEGTASGPSQGALLNTDIGPAGIPLTGTALSDLRARFGDVKIPGKDQSKWRLARLQLTTFSNDDPLTDGAIVQSFSFSDWKGTLNSALRSSGLAPLPGPLGQLIRGTPSVEVKRKLGLAESEGTVKFCPAMVPQTGKSDVFCRLEWDQGARLLAVRFSSRPFERQESQ